MSGERPEGERQEKEKRCHLSYIYHVYGELNTCDFPRPSPLLLLHRVLTDRAPSPFSFPNISLDKICRNSTREGTDGTAVTKKIIHLCWSNITYLIHWGGRHLQYSGTGLYKGTLLLSWFSLIFCFFKSVLVMSISDLMGYWVERHHATSTNSTGFNRTGRHKH